MSHTFLSFQYSILHAQINAMLFDSSFPLPSCTFSTLLFPFSSAMVPTELEKPRVTEIQVRMDCNGCVQKIKKALHGINGIYDIYIDFPQQKLTIIGWADPEKIVKAIKKTRKVATICSHIEATPSPPPDQPPPEGGAPPPESTNPPPPEAPPSETSPATEPPRDPPPPETPPPDQPPPEGQPPQNSRPKEEEEVHVVCHHPPDYGHRYGYGPHTQYVQAYSGHMNSYPTPNGPGFRNEPPQPVHVNHSYNTYKPSPYVTEYEYVRPPPQYTNYNRPEPPQYTNYSRSEPPQYTHHSRPEPPQHTNYSRPEPPQNMHYSRTEPTTQYTYYSRPEAPQHVHYSRTEPTTQYTQYSRPEPSQFIHQNRMEQYSDDYYRSSNNGNSNITSIFSDENPNACRIV